MSAPYIKQPLLLLLLLLGSFSCHQEKPSTTRESRSESDEEATPLEKLVTPLYHRKNEPELKVPHLNAHQKANQLQATDWLMNSTTQMNARGYGLWPGCVTSFCISDRGNLPEGLISSYTTADSLFVEWQIKRNCCHSFACDYEILDNETVNLIAHEYGDNCGCYCTHRLRFSLSINCMGKEAKSSFEGLKYVTINGSYKALLQNPSTPAR